ncbi:hypothetical protein PV10_05439 [Exophiala mesophila]|uniref:Uncharacterized protein n=1 Tax=Exophiala mesophila TaxID=212818 RepID=A0A0D1XRT9_EXOME|nr:uncharacterized protein PV10_05439 [Exophiala mesophila]KIV90831.1 hypothetical protein PV10_05439 [Exophiala mesophila]
MQSTMRLTLCSRGIHTSSVRHLHTSCSKRAAIPSPKNAPKRSPSKLPSPPIPSRRPPSPASRLKNEDVAKDHYAQKLLSAGTTILYRAPSHAGMLCASYFFGASGIGMALAMTYLDDAWRVDKNPSLNNKVKLAWKVGIAFCAMAGGLSLVRPLHMVRSIDLISRQGSPKLLLQVRRPLPFLAPRQYTVAPFAVNAENTFVRPIEEPKFIADTSPTSNPFILVARAFSKAAFYVFISVRKFASQDGIMKINFEHQGKKRSCQLDTSGKFLHSGNELVFLLNREPDF